MKPHQKKRWPRFFKNCRATEKEEEVEYRQLLSSRNKLTAFMQQSPS
jgi:hypothetical protein